MSIEGKVLVSASWLKKIVNGTPFIWLAMLLVVVVSFVGLTIEVMEFLSGDVELIGTLDHEILAFLVKYRMHSITNSALDITSLGSSTTLLIVVLITSAYLFTIRKARDAISLICALVGSGGLTWLLKSSFERTRPELEFRLVEVNSYSYPSGHSVGAAAIYLMIALILVKSVSNIAEKCLISFLMLTLIILVGASRMYLGVHFFSDVLGGLLIGFGLTMTIVLTQKFLVWRMHARKDSKSLQ